ncbi:MAG: TPM domain-containing protein [Lactobacillales bacterium]|jgi:uncharacterized protein|nr:TPM domain-containing protein [Lactobacillales bacterium]
MRKKWLFLTLFLGFFLFAQTAQAEENRVNDQAGLFSPAGVAQINNLAQSLSEKTKAGVFVVTTTENDEEPRDYADDYLREKVGNNNNGTVLLIDMDNREVYVSTSGNMIYYLNDNRIEQILDDVQPELSNSNFDQAGLNYLNDVETFFDKGLPKGAYSVDEETGKVTVYKTITRGEAIIAVVLAAGLAITFCLVTVSRYQLKMGTWKYPYKQLGKVNLTTQQDILTNSFVTTRHIPKNNNNGGGLGGGGSTTHSSGGGTFGGGGRGF